MSNSLRPHGLEPTRVLRPWDFPSKGTEVGCHFLLQGIFLTQGWNLGLSHCMQTLYCFEPPRTEKYDQAAAENGCDEGDFRGEWTTPALG